MAARIEGFFDNELKEKINNCKLLVVGAGGIGCELLKTLVLSGFENIHVIDLDTIDLSNLNRQFLFHKQHIGKSKAVVAKESALKFNPKADITAIHDSITNPKYNVEFYRQFTAVANALDNVGARSHVNRMCMAAEIPLIESGSAGYLGQTTVYKRKVTECFECLPRKAQKTYPGCTIRNTPSEPVHCIVWAKHLFNQLFGESDAEDEVSPEADPSQINTVPDGCVKKELGDGEEALTKFLEISSKKISTRELAATSNFDTRLLFKKLFYDDILYLKLMENLWKTRKPPTPLVYERLPDAVPGSSHFKESDIQDLRIWTVKECEEVFGRSLKALHQRVVEGGSETVLIWDKDDNDCLDFVAACANLRAHCFSIQQKSRFDVKAIAGNIIPAIATTNAIVAGLVVLQIFKVLRGDLSKCRTSWINENFHSTNKLISCGQLEKPNPNCLVCSTDAHEVSVKVNMKSLTLRTLEDKVLKEKLHMVQPDVVINDGSGSILISSDPDDMSDGMYERTVASFNLETDSRLLCEDFLQNFKILLVLLQDDDLSGQDFTIDSDLDNVKPGDEAEENSNETQSTSNNAESNNDDLDMEVEEDIEIVPLCLQKSSAAVEEEENGVEPPTKRLKSGTE